MDHNPNTAYLELLDIIRWKLKNPPEIETNITQTSPIQINTIINNRVENSIENKLEKKSLDEIDQCVKDCTRCGLHKTRTQTVFGTGNPQAKIMFIGEAPGAEEDKQGKPFVGRAGMLLTQMLKGVGLAREEVYIANILKCRPPNNRDPQAQEVESCTPYLLEQMSLIKPQLLVALGRIASHFLLNTTTSLSKLRGQVLNFNHTPLIVTYHPAYLLRTPQDKAKAYEDLRKISELIRS